MLLWENYTGATSALEVKRFLLGKKLWKCSLCYIACFKGCEISCVCPTLTCCDIFRESRQMPSSKPWPYTSLCFLLVWLFEEPTSLQYHWDSVESLCSEMLRVVGKSSCMSQVAVRSFLSYKGNEDFGGYVKQVVT